MSDEARGMAGPFPCARQKAPMTATGRFLRMLTANRHHSTAGGGGQIRRNRSGKQATTTAPWPAQFMGARS